MAGKELCSCGCGKRAVKEGLSYKCYKKKFGKAPWSAGAKKPNKSSSRTKSSRGKAGIRNGARGRECEGCRRFRLQLEEAGRVEKIMVAAGLVPAGKFEQARKIVRELE